ncbi:hypothetical protein GIW70_10975 [Pseudomonas syringae]|nr:hypothetical protein [Pseudomonas syringae]MCF5068721.1 hypothetical protein [Pseudomonas syringae]
MARKLGFWGISGTSVYVVIILTTVAFKFESFLNLKLNELGDFLAGALGPIALLWLVLGFFQQGRELKLSTDALQLQAQELKNSVEQQAEMTRIQTVNLANQDRLLQPLFEIKHLEKYHWEGDFYERFQITNSGGYCDCVAIALMVDDSENICVEVEPMNRGTDRTFSVESYIGRAEFHVSYRAINDAQGCRIFDLDKWYGEDDGEEGLTARQRPQAL